jgi:hypothetical protein
MSTLYDIYDPPPAPPLEFAPSKREPLVFTAGDLFCLVGLCSLLLAGAIIGWRGEPMLALITAVAGSLVILESWFTALGYLHRRKPLSLRARWTIFLAALVPWLVGLGIAASLMLGLFWIFDRFGWG